MTQNKNKDNLNMQKNPPPKLMQMDTDGCQTPLVQTNIWQL